MGSIWVQKGVVLREKTNKNRKKMRKIDVNFEAFVLIMKGLSAICTKFGIANYFFCDFRPPKTVVSG
jgi:hypothetical protein